jgi:hypothetical protein
MTVVFPADSRYATTPTATITGADGQAVAYLRRRFLPPPERFALLQWHQVVQGERLDTIAAAALGDPTQFWRLADANRAMQPDALTATVGAWLRITLPDGIPGVPHA